MALDPNAQQLIFTQDYHFEFQIVCCVNIKIFEKTICNIYSRFCHLHWDKDAYLLTNRLGIEPYSSDSQLLVEIWPVIGKDQITLKNMKVK